MIMYTGIPVVHALNLIFRSLFRHATGYLGSGCGGANILFQVWWLNLDCQLYELLIYSMIISMIIYWNNMYLYGLWIIIIYDPDACCDIEVVFFSGLELA